MKKNIIILISIPIVLIGIYFGWLFSVGPYMHDQVLERFSNQLLSIPVPGDTQLLKTTSIVGQQIGNGDHCDYLAAMQIQTNLSKEDVENYYRESYKGESEVNFIWLNEENEYTSDGFNPLVIFTLKDWIHNDLNQNSSLIVFIFEPSMTSSFDYRCS